MPCVTLRCRAVSCRALPCRALPCLALPCRAVPCLALPCLALPCRAVPCRAVPCRAVLFHTLYYSVLGIKSREEFWTYISYKVSNTLFAGTSGGLDSVSSGWGSRVRGQRPAVLPQSAPITPRRNVLRCDSFLISSLETLWIIVPIPVNSFNRVQRKLLSVLKVPLSKFYLQQ